MIIKSINPATEEEMASYDARHAHEIEDALVLSMKAFSHQKAQSYAQRAEKMLKVADILEEEVEALARLATMEMGKPLVQARSEVNKCALGCRFYAKNAENFLEDRPIETHYSSSYVRYFPLGAVLAVMPWNFPFWQVFRFAVPTIMAGNTALLKHASNVPQVALAIEDIFWRAGFEEGVFQTLLIGSDMVESIVADDRVKAVTLTGSEGAGSAVASAAGKHIKKCVLELGGSDAFIVMPSTDMEAALAQAVTARIQNNGQVCTAAKRFIVHEDVYEDFKGRMMTAFEALKIGDPLDEDTDVGPLARAHIRDDLEMQVRKSTDLGAVPLLGARVRQGKGYFYEPGLLESIPKDSPAYSEELFGPVGSLFKVSDIDAAITLANDTRFGLGAAVFTEDPRDIKKAVCGIEAGATFVNTMTASDPKLPFGGVKASGYGRELSQEGIREFTNIKTVAVA